MESVQQAGAAVIEQLERAIHGKSGVLKLVLACLLADGHLLLEDVPGTAKTLLAKGLARTLGGEFRRLQGTPDLLPGDVTGSSIYHPGTGEFEFHPGPVFGHILLADELNRATPRAQAALLECMAERQVTADGTTRPLPRPFFVIATQNPVDQEGTFPLPEAQLDRFAMRLSLGYPGLAAELQMLRGVGDPLDRVEAVLDSARLVELQDAVREVRVADPVAEYIVRVVSATRKSPDFVLGAGPRATRTLFRCAQAWAALAGRSHVLPDDVGLLLPSVVTHRTILGAEARLSGRSSVEALNAAIARIAAPVS